MLMDLIKDVEASYKRCRVRWMLLRGKNVSATRRPFFCYTNALHPFKYEWVAQTHFRAELLMQICYIKRSSVTEKDFILDDVFMLRVGKTFNVYVYITVSFSYYYDNML